MDRDAHWYALQRARKSFEAAQDAVDNDIAAIHLDLYDQYIEQARQLSNGSVVLRTVPRAR